MRNNPYLCGVKSAGVHIVSSWWRQLIVMLLLVACRVGAEAQVGSVTTLPWGETFSGATVGTTPSGWTTPESMGSAVATLGTLDGNCLYLYGLVASPRINIVGTPLADLLLTFQASVYNTANALIVGILSNPADVATFQPLDTLVVGSAWDTFTVSLRHAQSATGALAFRSQNVYTYIDNLHLDLAPNCLYPTHLRAMHIGASEVEIGWESDDSVTDWDIVCVPRGGDPDLAVPLLQHLDKRFTLNNLQPRTAYDLHVRSNCGGGAVSRWTTLTFETLSLPTAVPYQSGFELPEGDAAEWLLAADGLNRFLIGTDEANTGVGALYITNDTLHHQYDPSAASVAVALRPFVFTPGYYEVAFDWRGVAEGYTDYGRAFLVPYATVVDPTILSLGATAVPDGWIPLDDAMPLSGQSGWQTVRHRHNVAQTDTLMLLFCWRCNGSVGSQPPFAVDNLSINPLYGCFDPTDLDLRFLSSTSGILSWVASDTASYHVKIAQSPLANPATDLALVDTVVAQASLLVSNLAPATEYHCYVQTTCTRQQSAWHHHAVYTPCGAVSQLYQGFERFDYHTFPPCWTRGHTTGYTDPVVNTDRTTAAAGSNALAMVEGGYVVTPPLDVDITTVELSFAIYSASVIARSTQMIVGVTQGDDLSTFVAVDTIDVVNHAPAAQQHNVVFANRVAPGTHYRIAFHLVTTNHGMAYLDEVRVGEYRPCRRPFAVQASNLTTDGALLSWNTDNGMTHTLLVTTSEVDPDTIADTDAAVVLRLPQMSQTSVDLAGLLTPHTTYYAYVQSHCSPDSYSFWSEPLRFNTLCMPLSLPYEEHFSGTAYGPDIVPPCCTPSTQMVGALPLNGYQFQPYVYGGESSDGDHRCVRLFGYYAAAGSSKSALALPTFDAPLHTLRLALSHRTETGVARLLVGVMEDPAELASFTTLDTLIVTPLWKRETVRLDTYQGIGRTLALLLDGAENHASVTLFLDHLDVDTVAPCQSPVALRATPLDGNTISIYCETLTAADSLLQLQISKVNATNFLDDVDHVALVTDTTVRVDALPLLITNLDPSTTYYVYGRVVCGNGVASPRTYAVAETPCGRHRLPFRESFETMDASVGQTLPCWTSSSHTTPYLVSNSYGNKGKFVAMTPQLPSTVVLPDLDCDSLQQLILSLRIYNTYGGARMAVGICEGDDPTTFEGVDTIVVGTVVTNEWQDGLVNFGSYHGTHRRIAFKTLDYFYFDDLHIDYTQPCTQPSTPRITHLTTQGMTAVWSGGDSTTVWEVACRPQGVMPDTADTVVAQPTLSLKTLQGGMNYTLYVRTRCSGGVSRWVSTPFRTLSVLESLPLVTDFEDPADNARWDIRKSSHGWSFGSAIYHSPHTAMYVSQNDGMTTSYDAPSTLSWATRTIAVPQTGRYACSFDWRCVGDSAADFFRLFLLPTSTNLDAIGTVPPTGTLTGGIAVDSGRLVSSNWRSFHRELLIPQGNYLLAFVWVNDLTTHHNPPAAIDNFSLTPLTCYLADVAVHATDSAVVVHAVTDCPQVELTLSGSGLTLDTLVALPCTLGGLTPEQTYVVALRGHCADGDTTPWQHHTVATLCQGVVVGDSLPYSVNFDNRLEGSLPDCWNAFGNAGINTTYAASARGSLQLNATTDTYCYVTTPALLGAPLQTLSVRFSHRASGAGERLEIGVMETPGDEHSFTLLSTLVSTNGIWNIDERRSLANYTGSGRYLAFRMPATGGDPAAFYLDDVVVETPHGCNTPQDFYAQTDAATAVNLAFTPGSSADTLWQLKVATWRLSDPELQTVDIVDTLIHTPTVTLSHLTPLTTYYAYVRTVCQGDESGWATLTFETPCGIYPLPFAEDFSTMGRQLPSCWETGNAPLTAVLNGIQTLQPDSYYHWNKMTGGNGLNTDHLAVNVTGTYVAYWLITPRVVLDSATALSFDLALTAISGQGAILDSLAQQDDRFVVLARRNGNNWQQADLVAEWNNNDATRVYNEIAADGETVVLPLNSYGGDTVQLAFYVESTLFDVGAMLHLGRIALSPYHATQYLADTICENVDYQRNGFDVNALSLNADRSPYTLQRLAGDTLLTVTLAVLPVAETELTDTIVAGEIYYFCGEPLDHAGLYMAMLTAVNGCDSVVFLRLVNGEQTVDLTVVDDDALLHLAPNPVRGGGKVRLDVALSEAECADLLVEVLTADGQCITSLRPDHMSCEIVAPAVAGLYLVRVTTTSGRVLYSKLVISN